MDDYASFTLCDAAPVLEFWKVFDLDARRLILDQTCVDMREMKTSSISGRKRLNDATKSFRAKSRDEQVVGMTELLKLYQEEIDQLSRRSKFSESAFYSLYKSIYDAPNPSVTIDGLINMVTATSTNQLEIERLKGELAQYDEEFQLLKNQDITIRRLEDQLDEYREQIEDKVMEEVSKRTSEVQAQAELKINEVKDAQKTAERRLAAVMESMKQAQSSTDRAQTQMFEISSQAEDRVSALSSENAILAEGTERALSRAAELESEISSLRNLLSLAGSGSTGTGVSQRPGIPGGISKGDLRKGEEDCETLQLVISELRHEIRLKEDTLRAEKLRIEGKHRETLQLLSKEREALGKAKLELAERPTKDDLNSLRRQVKMLQRVAFNAQDDDEADALNMESKTIPSGDVIPLEVLLTSRMKALDTELAECKRNLKDAKMHEASAKETATSLLHKVESSATLITRLEADLESQLDRRGRGQDGSRGGKGAGRGGPAVLGGTGVDSSMDLSELLGVDVSTLSSPPLGSSGVGKVLGSSVENSKSKEGLSNQQNQNQQMVDILEAQRDRYKERLATSEAASVSMQNKLNAAEGIKLQLEQDNVALFSKIRYLQSLTGAGPQGSGSGKSMRIKNTTAYGMGDEEAGFRSNRSGGRGGYRDANAEESRESGINSSSSNNREGDRDLEGRYGALYEQRMNPFAEFSQIEKQKRLQDLSVADRMVLNTTLAIVSSKSGRSFIVIYLGAMHLLVFFILYFTAHHVQHGCDPAMDALHRGDVVYGHSATK